MKLLLFIIAALAMSLPLGVLAMTPALDTLHRTIEKRYPQVSHISAEEFASRNSDTLVVFDVRAREEYAVSHLAGAVRLEPDMSVADFTRQHGDRIAGKTVVFYCSVGQRSSQLAARMSQLLTDSARESFNLRGGLFHWRNEQRPLVIGDKATTLIHPYNFLWGRLLKDRDAIRYKP